MSKNSFKPLPIGNESFVSLREKGCYYVDKTLYLHTVFTNSSPVMLFTRPRRFGKTLLMDMFASFLSIAPDGSRDIEFKNKIFEGLSILKDKDFTDKYLGQFPVIFISLKGVFGETFKDAYGKLVEVIADLGEQFSFLGDSEKISKDQKEELALLRNKFQLSKPKYGFFLTGALKTFITCLHKHYGKRVILLIDEYDVPLAKAAEKGYHSQMVTLISNFFDFMKISPVNQSTDYPIEKIVLTGCLKVAKNSIFTGVNNLFPNTVLSEDDNFDSIIGFTKDETLQFLKDYDRSEYADMVKENYDGYRFNKKDMYCPWDVVNFIYDAVNNKKSGGKIIPGNYWINSTSSNALLSYVGFLSDHATDKMQALVDGKNIETTLNDSMNYDSLSKHEVEDFFSLLVHTGYLTAVSKKAEQVPGGKPKVIYSLRIPNLEIRECFETNIMEHFREVSTRDENKSLLIAKALFEGDCDTASDNIFDLLQTYVSVRDFATKAKPENFYHGFLSGVFTNCGSFITDFKSNSESGDGYADLIFCNAKRSKIVIIEIKVSDTDDFIDRDALKALEQIEEKNYIQPYINKPLIKDVYAYGISFYMKSCFIEMKKFK